MVNQGTTDTWADMATREHKQDALESAVYRAYGTLSSAEIRRIVEQAIRDCEEEPA